MTSDEQLEQWCNGVSVHNVERDECCPDFSCCNPKCAAPIEQCILFRDRPELRCKMLGMFLGNVISKECFPGKVYVSGSDEGNA